MKRVLALFLAVLPAAVSAQDSTPPPSVLVTTAAAHQGSLPRTLTAYGSVQAAPGSSETLSLLRAGQVTRVMVATGQKVQQGQPLLTLSADPAALATYRQAVTALALARGERDRMAQMLAQHLATRDQLAQAEKAVADAQSNLDLLTRGGGGSAEQTLAAPFEGVVSSLPITAGARIAAQTPLITLDRSSRLVAAVGIEPSQRGLVARGQPAQIEPLDGGAPTQGSVLTVGAMLDPLTRLVPVLIDPLPDGTQSDPGRHDPKGDPPGAPAAMGLLPGGSVRVAVQVGEFRGWLVPRDAVGTDAKGAYVFQVADGKAVRVDVQVAGMVGDMTAATGPLDPKRPLVTIGNTQLQDGAAVREEPSSAAAGVAAR
jgi:membrane fusion protein (multidrug efflux system)